MERRGIQVYLLPVEEFTAEISPKNLPGWDRLTAWQQARVSRCRRQSGTVRLRLGAELLLQYGAHRAAENQQQAPKGQQISRDAEALSPEPTISWQVLTGEQLLNGIPGPLPLEIIYGERGKPAVAHASWHYNLSHSGMYAALALSGAPVGIDIQKKGMYSQAMVKRFFSPEETAAYEKLYRCTGTRGETADLFYTLWCRKEAYGKLWGTGLTEDVLKRNMLEDAGVLFREWDQIPGYRICVCCEKG